MYNTNELTSHNAVRYVKEFDASGVVRDGETCA